MKKIKKHDLLAWLSEGYDQSNAPKTFMTSKKRRWVTVGRTPIGYVLEKAYNTVASDFLLGVADIILAEDNVYLQHPAKMMEKGHVLQAIDSFYHQSIKSGVPHEKLKKPLLNFVSLYAPNEFKVPDFPDNNNGLYTESSVAYTTSDIADLYPV